MGCAGCGAAGLTGAGAAGVGIGDERIGGAGDGKPNVERDGGKFIGGGSDRR